MTKVQSQPSKEPPPRISGPRYLITETDDRYWWRENDRRPVYVTPAHWWER